MTASSRSQLRDDLVERALELLRAGGRASGANRDAMLAQVDRIRRLLLQREVRRREPSGALRAVRQAQEERDEANRLLSRFEHGEIERESDAETPKVEVDPQATSEHGVGQ